ncbi:hypothetical protein [Leptospira soteropolitanensis]|nr:hypothetical protein [Leptospira soteropolitanensis]MCW7522421.1 hypothetical protein [Leptospira soteropolitanensis]
MFVLVDLLIGRLVYPMNVYPLTVETIVFILSLQVGTMHMISLVLALAILLYSFSFRKENTELQWLGQKSLIKIFNLTKKRSP